MPATPSPPSSWISALRQLQNSRPLTWSDYEVVFSPTGRGDSFVKQKLAPYEEFQGVNEGLVCLRVSDQDLRAAVESSLHKADSEPRVPDTTDESRPWDGSISRYICCESSVARLRPPCCRSCGEERAWNQWADRRGIPRTPLAMPAPHTRSTR